MCRKENTAMKENDITKMSFKVERDLLEKAQVLKDKHFINLSAMFRESIISLYNKLEGKQEDTK
jgi:hypothetical protein